MKMYHITCPSRCDVTHTTISVNNHQESHTRKPWSSHFRGKLLIFSICHANWYLWKLRVFPWKLRHFPRKLTVFMKIRTFLTMWTWGFLVSQELILGKGCILAKIVYFYRKSIKIHEKYPDLYKFRDLFQKVLKGHEVSGKLTGESCL